MRRGRAGRAGALRSAPLRSAETGPARRAGGAALPPVSVGVLARPSAEDEMLLAVPPVPAAAARRAPLGQLPRARYAGRGGRGDAAAGLSVWL